VPSDPSPKDRFTALDTLAVVRELRALGRPHVDKAFDRVDGGWSLVLRGTESGRRELLLVPGRFAAVGPVGEGHGEELSPIAREIRRVLTGASLRSVAEPAGERYLELTFGRASESEEIVLALEMFGSGNLILARGGRILAAATSRRWAHRDVRAGAAYVRPPSRSDPWTLGPAGIETELSRSRTDLASTLGARLSLGGPVAEEVIARGGWTGEEPAATSAATVAGRVHAILGELLSEIGDRPRGFLVRRGTEPVDATPYPSRRWSNAPDVEVDQLPTFSEAAATYFRTVLPSSLSPEETAATEERSQLTRLAERQRKAVESLAGAVGDRKADAEAVLAHYAEVEAAIASARERDPEARSAKVDVAGRALAVDLRAGPRKAAQAFFEESKRLAEKLAGATEALKETEARLARPRARSPASRAAAAASAPKRRWFDKYRWFVSSEGAVVVAGRDAPSNDTLVRRNLKDGDYYVHADLQGAASVLVKKPTPPAQVTEVTLREAAQWAVAFSKAWRAGLASASAFWATPDQVSKSAVSGEFVPRGAFVIRGTKHFVRDLPLELGIGKIRYEAEERWTVAPAAAVAARGAVEFLLTPGEDRERGEREKELARDLGISRTLVQLLLPAGGISARRP
jgi:predicted ribosome quality control (RQC) complex YloA/Tae2 family protein